jgi:amino acid transporter
MNNTFDLLSNLPQLIFALCFLIVFILFLWGGIVLLRARGDPEKIEKGRKTLFTAFVALFIVLLVVLIFYLFSYFLKRGEVFKPPTGFSKEFPSPFHMAGFPPAPQFISTGNYYFNGPLLLKENRGIKKDAIYTILCKKNGEYDIIYIDEVRREDLLKHKQYKCWLEKCNQNLNNLYIAIFWTPSGRYPVTERDKIKNELKEEFSPPCVEEEEIF